MTRNPLLQQVDTLPDLVQTMIDPLVRATDDLFTPERSRAIARVFLTGCGDSHHAPLNAELAFEQLAGLPCEPMTAMQFARYAAGFLPDNGRSLVMAVSVSGAVSRTVEAMTLARQAGALTVAVTGSPQGPLAQAADLVLPTAVPLLSAEMQGLIVPGTRSYVASQLALYTTAIQLGEMRGHLRRRAARELRQELSAIAASMAQTIAAGDATARRLVTDWHDADHWVFCGAGPNYGAALFAAAKLLEASGDVALGQDLEEWTHLQYFGKTAATPTILLHADGWDRSRALEVAAAARAIGRRVAAVAPASSALAQASDVAVVLPIPPVRECFSPLLTALPPVLIAAYRAELLAEPYFRGFGGGRSVEGGGGISRIRSSVQQTTLNR